MNAQHWPSWWYGPKGESAVFESANDVPRGWHNHPSKHENADSAAPVEEQKTRAPAKAKSKAGRKPKAAAAPLDL